MTALNDTFIEITMLPFLFVMTIFLAGRMSTKNEVNRRFLFLVFSTFLSALYETLFDIFPAMNTDPTYTKIFYAIVNINGYCLMCYIAAYTHTITRRLVVVNYSILVLAVMLQFMFMPHEKIYMLFSPGAAVMFAAEGFIMQLINQKYYGNGQFLVMNLLFMLLLDSFVVQYLFSSSFPLVYTASAVMLFFTFFYLEAPTYRQLISARADTEAARLRTEESIKKANIANKAKSNFLASTSHEIRTPMNAILGINDMILAEKPDPETRKAALDIKTAGEYLLGLVNNILDISKIEAGKMDLFESDYHLWELLKECESFIIERIKNNNSLRFELDADKNLEEHLHGDVLRLKQVLINLLSNAEKYTRSGKIILKVSGEEQKGAGIILTFTIEDTGIGMKEEDQKKIFEPFERANLIETRNVLGAGLGLTLVKNILDIMNGKIEINSTYGKGTAITFSVPQKFSAGEKITIAEYDEIMRNKELNAPKDLPENNKTSWPDAKILVVDDTPVNLVVAKGMLKESGAKIETSESGEDALELMKKNHYDLVFLDHKMPGMDGIETLKHAKKYAPNTKFIALTANAGANARNEYITLGFDDYLPKPFKADEMIKILRACLK